MTDDHRRDRVVSMDRKIRRIRTKKKEGSCEIQKKRRNKQKGR